MYRTVLVVGNEKMSGRGTRAVLDALASAADVDRIEEFNRELTGCEGAAESFFMEVYAQETRDYMARTGATRTLDTKSRRCSAVDITWACSE